jgi:predicted nucleic acid-binding protein
MMVVLDASAAVGITLMQPQATPLITQLESAALVLVPDLFVSEVCNAFWKYRKAGLLDQEQADQALSMALELPDRVELATTCYQEAFALAVRHQHPFYDALYLVLARRHAAALLTIDKRLAALAHSLEIQVFI